MKQLTRRTVVAGLSGVAVANCAPLKLTGPFPLGVSSGDATESGALLWTFYEGTAETLEALVWPDADDVATAKRVTATPADGYTQVEITGLASGEWFNFRFESSTHEVSTTGRFRTAIASDALLPLTLAATCCIKSNHSYGALEHAAQRTDLDAFIFLGDSVYTDGSSSLADYRHSWASGIVKPEYQALRASTSMITQWDDHEVRNNWDGDSVDPTLLANARQAFLEHQPFRRAPETPLRFWRKRSWGQTVDLFVLDSRSERNRALKQYLSPEQAQWLITGITQSTAMFKLVLNTVPIGSFDSAFFAPFNGDNWQAFPEQRAQILQAFDDAKVTGVIFLSGDFHFACVGRVAAHGPGSGILETLVGPGAQAPNPNPSYPNGGQWEFSSGINNYTTFAFDPSAEAVTIRYIAEEGRVLFEKTYAASALGG